MSDEDQRTLDAVIQAYKNAPKIGMYFKIYKSSKNFSNLVSDDYKSRTFLWFLQLILIMTINNKSRINGRKIMSSKSFWLSNSILCLIDTIWTSSSDKSHEFCETTLFYAIIILFISWHGNKKSLREKVQIRPCTMVIQ